ncbi:hypothetical protein K435DRAFT_775080 [Dendrothele bispora CBS 962.96]|uniref:LysM domain-containing protein n=1 Tax=Dendrothele bispora (strain CBS 962.96) TaxID=1314807 RepID=A0A4S8MKR2_DENBC|nr:hypothetical protein K435DRAFT_775080 [Dendrothele bispora CBS 962.96]
MPAEKFDLDSITSLCLACSSSLPPKVNSETLFTTSCCRQPICSTCISSNPRLARYNPCLSCLGGVDAVNARSTAAGKSLKNSKKVPIAPEAINIDGAVRDEDTYIIGDDEDVSDDEDGFGGKLDSSPPPPYPSSSNSPVQPSETSTPPNEPFRQAEDNPEAHPHNPYEYYIKKGDTLQGISLKFGVDGRELCRLNKLPPTTLSTTPYLLHTRGVLTLPPNAKLVDKSGNRFTNDPGTIEEEKARAMGE